jgi:endonuclease-3
MSDGTYTLLVALADPATIEVGALGVRSFTPGWYAYTGSAFGPGGFARIERHRELAAGERDARHWHVDHLLGHPETAVRAVGRTPGEDVECAVARQLVSECEAIEGFGASDCDCDTHLAFTPERDPIVEALDAAHTEFERLTDGD